MTPNHRPACGGGNSLPRQQIARGGLQDVLSHAWLACVDAARFGFADIILEPLPTLVRNRAQDNDGPVIADLNVLPIGHGLNLAFVAAHRQRSQERRQFSNSLRKA